MSPTVDSTKSPNLNTGIRDNSVPFFIRPITNNVANKLEDLINPNIKTNFEFLESQIATSPGGGAYLCGKALTGADILISFPIIAAGSGVTNFTKSLFPRLWAYKELLEANSSYKKAVEKIIEIEGKYEVAI